MYLNLIKKIEQKRTSYLPHSGEDKLTPLQHEPSIKVENKHDYVTGIA